MKNIFRKIKKNILASMILMVMFFVFSNIPKVGAQISSYLEFMGKPNAPFKMHLSSYINPTYKKWRNELNERRPASSKIGKPKMTDWDAMAKAL